MRVAIVQETLDPARGGAETSTREMAAALAALGLRVTLVGTAGPRDPLPPPGVAAVALRPAGLTRAGRTRAFLRLAREHVAQGGYDVVHAIVPLRGADVYQPRGGTYLETIRQTLAVTRNPIWRAAKALGRRFHARQQLLLRAELDLLRRDPPHVAALSEYVCEQVRAAAPGLPESRLHRILNGVTFEPLEQGERARLRAEVRSALGVRPADCVVLFVAHNFALKGLRELLHSAASEPGRRTGWFVTVAGRGRAGPYERLAKRLNVRERVRFVGAGWPMRGLYAAADVVAHPTWYDPCSRVVLEAVCAGVPVVTTRFNGARDALPACGPARVIAAPDAVEELAEAVAALATPAAAAEAQFRAPAASVGLSMTRHARELILLYNHIPSAKRDSRI